MPTGRTTVAYDPEAEAARQAELAKQAQFSGLMTPSQYADALFVPPDAAPPPENYIPGSTYVPPAAYEPEPYLPSSTYDPALSPSAYQPQNPYSAPSYPAGTTVEQMLPVGSGEVPDANGPGQTAPYGDGYLAAPPPPPVPSTLYGGPSGMLPSRPDQIQTSYPSAGASPYNTLYNNPLGTRQGAPPPYDESQPSNPYAVDRYAHRRELAELYQGAGEPQFQPPPISMLGMTDDVTGMPGVPAYAQQPGVIPLPAEGDTNWAANWDQHAQDIIDSLALGDRAGGIMGGIGNLLFPVEPAYAKGINERTGKPMGGGGGLGRGSTEPVGINPRPGTAQPVEPAPPRTAPRTSSVDPAAQFQQAVGGVRESGFRGYGSRGFGRAASYTAPRSAAQVGQGASASPRGGINAQGGVGSNPYGPRPTLTQQARANYTPPSENPGMRQAVGSAYGRNTSGVGSLARGAAPRGGPAIPGGSKGLAAAALGASGLAAGAGLGLIDNVQFGGGSTETSVNPYGPVTEQWKRGMWGGEPPVGGSPPAPASKIANPAAPFAGRTTSDEPIGVITLDADGIPLLNREASLQAAVKGGSPIRMLTPEEVAALVASGAQISEKAAQDLLIGKRVVIPAAWQAILDEQGGGVPATSGTGTGTELADATVGATSGGGSSDNGGGFSDYGGSGGYGGGYQIPTENSGYGYELPPLPEGFGTGGGMFLGDDSDFDGSTFEEMMGNPIYARYFEIFSKAMGPDRARLFMRRFGRNFKGMDRAYRSTGKRTKTARSKRTPSLATESASAERKPTTPDNATMQKQIRRDVAKRTGTKPKKDAA